MKTLFEQYPDAWTKIEQAGFVNLTEMSRRFIAPGLMDAALGYASAAHKWNKGRLPGSDAERRAKAWLHEQRGTSAEANGAEMLIVVCPDGASAKARKLLSILGCEVEAI